MSQPDAFALLARYYDAIMSHVDYDRWDAITTVLSEILPHGFRHLDAACGTGRFVDGCAHAGWKSAGVDLSLGMLRAAQARTQAPLAAADLRALPFHESYDLITCLFDSLNFILDEDGIREAIASCAAALRPGGIFYFDVVTERMVTEYFSGPAWTEENGGFRTTWKTEYDAEAGLAETSVRINHGEAATIREQIYSREVIESAIKDAGLALIVCADAENWKPPRANTIRLDFVVRKPPVGEMNAKKLVAAVREQIL